MNPLTHIVGIPSSVKYGLKLLCKRNNISIVQWVEQHLDDDLKKEKESKELKNSSL